METYQGEPCYFYVDEKKYLRALCSKCGKESGKGWKWHEGKYGNWDVTCYNCGHMIHKKKNVTKKKNKTTN